MYLRESPNTATHFLGTMGAFFFSGLFSFLNFGKKRSQFSFFMEGSYASAPARIATLASSRLIISVLIA